MSWAWGMLIKRLNQIKENMKFKTRIIIFVETAQYPHVIHLNNSVQISQTNKVKSEERICGILGKKCDISRYFQKKNWKKNVNQTLNVSISKCDVPKQKLEDFYDGIFWNHHCLHLSYKLIEYFCYNPGKILDKLLKYHEIEPYFFLIFILFYRFW